MRIDPARREEVSRTIPSWENSGLRNRVEGRDLGGIDVMELQLVVVERTAEAPRKRRRRKLR
ncbi:MAG: hypothetical protein ACXWZF_08335 [Actinomycetota bacterium]